MTKRRRLQVGDLVETDASESHGYLLGRILEYTDRYHVTVRLVEENGDGQFTEKGQRKNVLARDLVWVPTPEQIKAAAAELRATQLAKLAASPKWHGPYRSGIRTVRIRDLEFDEPEWNE